MLEGVLLSDVKKKLTKILSTHSQSESELIPVLQATQEKFGYLPEQAMCEISNFLGIAESVIYGVATFYTQFKFAPTGKKVVRICRGTACHVRGGARILSEVERRLGIKQGETTEDLGHTLETVACIGACALAPIMTIGKDTYGQMTTKKVAELVGDKRKTKQE